MRCALAVLAGLCLVGCSSTSNPAAPPPPGPAAVAAVAISLTAGPAQHPVGGGASEVTIFTASNPGGTAAAPRMPVAIEASSGELSIREVVTGETGHAKVTWTGTQTAVLSARAGELTATLTIPVASTPVVPPPTTPPPPDPGPPAPQPPSPSPDPGPTPPGPARDLVLTIVTNPAQPVVGQPVIFSSTLVSSTGATVPAVLRWMWNLDGDSFPDAVTAPSASYTFGTVGSYRVWHGIRTSDNREFWVPLDLTVVPVPPPPLTVSLGTSTPTPTINTNFTLTANVINTLPGETITMYRWDYDNDGTFDATTVDPGGNIRTYQYTQNGPVTARVTITTSTGRTATATIALIVQN